VTGGRGALYTASWTNQSNATLTNTSIFVTLPPGYVPVQQQEPDLEQEQARRRRLPGCDAAAGRTRRLREQPVQARVGVVSLGVLWRGGPDPTWTGR
jgi:hypothetical protein